MTFFSQQSQRPDNREFRVFISSTFLDMKQEREYLVHQIFPELQQVCRDRGVLFTSVDLRWGITDRQARMGKIVSNCLENIHRHRPFVIALIGERYGWQPGYHDLGKNPTEVLEEYPWLAAAIEAKRSLVELETIESAKHNRDLRNRMRFYLRGGDDTPRNGNSRNVDDTASLLGLKDRIRSSGLPVREPYSDVETLGKWVREDLLTEFERRYPTSQWLSFIELERRAHEAFAASRRRVYVEHAATLQQLDEYVAADARANTMPRIPTSIPDSSLIPHPSALRPPPSPLRPHPSALVITGDSGSGKSALLSFWGNRYREQNPDAFIITHYVGATATSTSHLGLLRRIMLEIQERYGITAEVPNTPEKIESEFRYWLGYVRAEGGGQRDEGRGMRDEGGGQRDESENNPSFSYSSLIPHPSSLVLVIDALNQLNESSRRVLTWLPEYFPSYVRVIVSTLDDEILTELQRRNWQVVNVKPLTKQGRMAIVKSYLHSFGKELDSMNVRRLVSDPKSVSPLFLVTTMEELRVSSSHEDLSRRIGHYLEAKDLDDVYQRVLERMENDYGKTLVREVMSLIWASHNGLSKDELLGMTKCSQVSLLRLLHGLGDNLLVRDGLLGFFHDYLRRGVEQRYLAATARQRRMHQRLAGHFTVEDVTQRSASELVYHLWKAEEWGRLRDALSTIPVFVELYQGVTKYSVLAHWQRLKERGYDIEESYRVCLDAYRQSKSLMEELADTLSKLGALLEITGHWEMAAEMYRRMLELKGLQSASAADAERGLGRLHRLQGRYAEAVDHFELSLMIASSLDDRQDTSRTLGEMGTVYHNLGNYQRALECFEQQKLISTKFNDQQGISMAMNNMGNAYRVQGDYQRALECYAHCLSIDTELGNRQGISVAVGNMGTIYLFQGDYQRALEHYGQLLSIATELGDRLRISSAVNNMGVVYMQQTNYQRALECFEQKKSIAADLGDPRGVFNALLNMGRIYGEQGEYQRSFETLEQSKTIVLELGDQQGIAQVVGHMASVYADQCNYQRALECFDSALEVQRAIGFLYGVPTLLHGKSDVLLELVRTAHEMPTYLQSFLPHITEATWRAVVLQTTRELVGECEDIPEHLQGPSTLLSNKVLLARIEAEEGRRDSALQQLYIILDEAIDDDQRADIHFWLWKITMDNSDDQARIEDVAETHRCQSLRLYEQLLERTPQHIYNKRVKELTIKAQC